MNEKSQKIVKLRMVAHFANLLGIGLVGLAVKFHFGFIIWNILPLIIASFLLEVVPRTKGQGWRGSPPGLKGCAIGSYLGLSLVTIIWNLAWILNLGEIATESSTSGIAFIFIPIWSSVFGVAGAIIGRLIGKYSSRHMHN
jgi:hypothetical protein